MAVIDDVKTAYKAVIRIDLNDVAAQAVADAITSGQTTLDAYIDQLITQAAPSTVPAVAFASFFQGVTPDSARTDALAAFSAAQFASYTKLGVGNPSLGPYEALGLGFATDPSTSGAFQTKYGALSDAQFVNTAYAEVYGQPPSTGAAANLLGQITYFNNLYIGAGISASDAAVRARGATLGQIVGYAFTDPVAATKTVLDNQVDIYLTALAHGATNIYGKALPTVIGPGNPGSTLTLTDGADVVDPAAGNLALKSTQGDDIIRGLTATALSSADVINAAAGLDTVVSNAVALAATTVTPVMTSVELAFLAGQGGTVFNAASSSGLQQLWNDASNVAGSTIAFKGMNLDVTVGIKGAASTTVATFNGVTGGNDTANFVLSGSAAGSKLVANSIEHANIAVQSNAGIIFDDNALQVLTLTASPNSVSSNLKLALTPASIANLTTIDASGLKGGLTTSFAAVGDLTVKGGAGNDSLDLNTPSTNKMIVDGGSGNDFIYAGAGNDTLNGGAGDDTIDGYFGKDSITLGEGNDVVRYKFVGESKGSGFDTITDFKVAGADRIDVSGLPGGGGGAFVSAPNQIAAQNAVDLLPGSATLAQALTAALGAGKIGLNQTGYFNFQGDTYAVVNKSTAAFVDADDLVVKISGVQQLAAGDFIL